MKDSGQFQRVEVWNGRFLEISLILYPSNPGTQVRVATGWDVNHLAVAHILAGAIQGLDLQNSQKELALMLLQDLEVSLGDYPDIEEIDNDVPF